jgi:hypothetical protein
MSLNQEKNGANHKNRAVKNDFLDLFRQPSIEQAPQYRPSPKVWRKLERRLDGYDRWRKLMERNAVVWVYLVLFLVILVTPVIVGLLLREQQQVMLRTPKAVVKVLSEKDSLSGVRQMLEQGAQKNQQPPKK